MSWWWFFFSCVGCGRRFNGSRGDIISPNFPKQYDNNMNCTYFIDVEPQSLVILTFVSFHLEGMFIPSQQLINFNWQMIKGFDKGFDIRMAGSMAMSGELKHLLTYKFLIVRTSRIYSFSNAQVDNASLLIIIPMLYRRFSEFIPFAKIILSIVIFDRCLLILEYCSSLQA